MLSHLRFHRRNPSNPPSPLPDQLSQWESAVLHEHPQATQDVSPRPDMRPRSSNSTNTPPFLPPIQRVTSSEIERPATARDEQRPATQDSRPPPSRALHNAGNTGFMGGAALQTYRRGLQPGSRPETAGNSQPSMFSESRPPAAPAHPPPLKTSLAAERPSVPARAVRPASSVPTSTDPPAPPLANTGKRSTGLRLTTEPTTIAAPAAVPAALPESSRGKKGLPFLKNPMSTLLLRRRTSQNAPALIPLPLSTQQEEPIYDPRIRGTRVHDFSAPRPPRRIFSGPDAAQAASTALSDGVVDTERPQVAPATRGLPGLPHFTDRPLGPHEDRIHLSDKDVIAASAAANAVSPADGLDRSVEQLRPSSRLSYDSKPLPEQPLPPLPIKDDAASSFQTSSSIASRVVSIDAPSSMPRSSPSTRASFSRNVSLSGASLKSSKSGRPRHMKSTSSRFSFDMIGAAKQEKLLEERHRQRALEKTNSNDGKGSRDSRFDDMDDDFDYDAMMDDDGLEERIPGVNADFEDEEDEIPGIMEEVEDEDADGGVLESGLEEDSFSGFRFQQSGPPSAVDPLPDHATLETPRDATGKVIGSALTKDITPSLPPTASPQTPAAAMAPSGQDDSVAGLGIQGMDVPQPLKLKARQSLPSEGPTVIAREPVQPLMHDDIYFDDGLEDELDFEHDGTHFDESLFDLNDTDKYGRPIPGAFAEAKLRSAAKQEAAKRESDMTSRLSAQSALSQSTAHTSVSAELPQSAGADSRGKAKDEAPSVVPTQGAERPTSFQPPSGLDKVVAYQAALAEAAHMAAASGKFRRDSSSERPADLTITSPTDSSGSHPRSRPETAGLRAYEGDDGFGGGDGGGLDDYELDDDDIIAEANASALADDSDGFYSQEFGFYSMPAAHAPGHNPSNANGSLGAVRSNGKAAALNAENLYQYAHGGYFGPAGPGGVNRTTSGRIVSREPNLTPITERSEYSNRNSIMSLAVPPPGGWGSGGGATSPGLAQLAMMAEYDDDLGGDMSVSAFLRLRAKAFSGSQISLASSSRDGSPRAESSGAAAPTYHAAAAGGGHGRKNSAFSVWSRESDVDSGSGSPTLLMSGPTVPANGGTLSPSSAGGAGGGLAALSPGPRALSPAMGSACPPVFEEEDDGDGLAAAGAASMAGSGVWMKSPVNTQPQPLSAASMSASRRPAAMGHRHKGSADSISYIKEEESSGETRWVVERRRTAETGEIEILGREIVDGGMI